MRFLRAGAAGLRLATCAISLTPAWADSKPVLSLADAQRLAQVGAAAARNGSAGGAIAVVDDGGHLLALLRLDGTFPAAATVATEKARTAATFRKPTRDFESAVNGGRTALVGVDVMTPLQGGIPLLADGQVVGAVGVSGANSAQQDDEIAKAAVAAFEAGTAEVVTEIDAATVRAAFAAGKPLFETRAYKIHASRRDRPGEAEIHERDSDLIYVLEGTATFVTGGSVPNAREVAPGELRGAAIEGGTARELVAGEVIVVPAGTPHWFERVPGPFVYYVVKVTEAGGL
jgi:glc operon protein GlcG